MNLRALIIMMATCLLVCAASCGHSAKSVSSLQPQQLAVHQSSSQSDDIRSALTELDSLPCPAGVEPALWLRIKDAFRKRAEDRVSGKGVSDLLATGTNVPDLTWTQASYSDPVILSWGYVLPGDFNQDGVVSVADLTPYAQNYGQEWDPELILGEGSEYNTMTAVCDADQNGAVEIFENQPDDLDVMASHFGDTVAGYSIEGADTDDAPPDTAQYSTAHHVDHDDVGPKPYQARLRYHKEISSVSATSYYWVRPYDMEVVYPAVPNYGEYSTDYADLRPEIGPIKPQTPSGQHGSAMKFSYSPDTSHAGPIVSQEWDFGDAGTPDSTTSVTKK